MPGIGTVERFVADWEVRDDVAFDRGLQKRPLEPGRITQVASSDATRAVDPDPGQNVPAEALSESDPFSSILGCRLGKDSHASSRQPAEDLLDQRDALFDLSKADPHARIDVTAVEDRHVKFEFVVRRIGKRFARIERTAGGAADIAAGPVLTCKSRL